MSTGCILFKFDTTAHLPEKMLGTLRIIASGRGVRTPLRQLEENDLWLMLTSNKVPLRSTRDCEHSLSVWERAVTMPVLLPLVSVNAGEALLPNSDRARRTTRTRMRMRSIESSSSRAF